MARGKRRIKRRDSRKEFKPSDTMIMEDEEMREQEEEAKEVKPNELKDFLQQNAGDLSKIK